MTWSWTEQHSLISVLMIWSTLLMNSWLFTQPVFTVSLRHFMVSMKIVFEVLPYVCHPQKSGLSFTFFLVIIHPGKCCLPWKHIIFYNSDLYYFYFSLSIYYSCCNNKHTILCLTSFWHHGFLFTVHRLKVLEQLTDIGKNHAYLKIIIAVF